MVIIVAASASVLDATFGRKEKKRKENCQIVDHTKYGLSHKQNKVIYTHMVVPVLKNLPANTGDVRHTGSIPQLGSSLEEGMATHFSILAWRIPQTDEPGRLWSIASEGVRYDWSDLACTHVSIGSYKVGHNWRDLACMHIHTYTHLSLHTHTSFTHTMHTFIYIHIYGEKKRGNLLIKL